MTKLQKSIFYMIIASFSFFCMSICIKFLNKTIPSIEIAFFRNLVGLLLLSLSMIIKKPALYKKNLGLLLFRSFIGVFTLFLVFYNIVHMPLADAMSFLKLTPIFTSFFAWLFLKEKLPKIALLALGLSFLGVILILKPSGDFNLKYLFTGIFSGIGAALAYTAVRELRLYYSARYIVFTFCLIGTILPSILMFCANYIHIPFLDFLMVPYISPNIPQIILLISLGILALTGQLFLTKAYAYSKAAIVSCISYIAIIFSLTFDIFYIEKIPSLLNFLGISCIIMGGIIILNGNNKAK